MSNKWFLLFGCFLAYLFDALEIVVLSFALPAIRQEFGLSAAQAGFLATATLLGIGLSSLCAGWLADNLGRKIALLTFLIVFGTFTALGAVAPSFAVLIVLRLTAGIGLGGVWSVVSAYTVESWHGPARGRAVAFVMSAFPTGGAVGALLAGPILPDWRNLFFIAGSGAILPVLVVSFFRESRIWADDRAARDETDRTSLREIFVPPYRRRTLLGAAVVLLAQAAYHGTSTWLPTYLTSRNLGPADVSRLLFWANIAMLLGNYVFGFIADKYGRRPALLISLFGLAAVLPVYAMVSTRVALMTTGLAFFALAGFVVVLSSYLGELYPTRMRTTGAGFCFNFGRGVAAFSPLALGIIIGASSITIAYLVSAGLFVLAALAAFGLPKPTGAADVDVVLDTLSTAPSQLTDPVDRS